MSNQLCALVVACCVVAPMAQAQYAALAVTFTNPAPAFNKSFGSSVAALGNNRVVIGESLGGGNVGAAHLFNSSGTMLTTFTNPTPLALDYFGASVAAVGNDRVLIGAYLDDAGAANVGAAYLFDTNGTRLITFTNPTPQASDWFGLPVAAVGNDRVLIGAAGDNTGATDAGAAYLFTTNGTLLNTFTNPNPFLAVGFGTALCAVGSDRVLIAAPLGDAASVYLFTTNGTLLATFTNPVPALSSFNFGAALCAVGNDRVLIGSPGDDTGTTDAGAAHLFSAGGTLLTNFFHPTPAANHNFGAAVATLGGDRFLIGAPAGNTFLTTFPGRVFLYSTNRTLLNTFTNPTPASGDVFGVSLAAVGSDRVVIAAPNDDTVGPDAGAAYLYSFLTTNPPSLAIVPATPGSATVSWSPTTALDYVLQENTNIVSNDWVNSPSGSTNPIVVPTSLPAKFYRLIKP